MCGIIGILERKNVAPMIRKSLKRLEYRGYDSVGVCTVHEGKLHIKKDKGKIDEIHARLNLDDLPGSVGIGHTRWATHGAPSQVNAHPHTDCSGTLALVHNGIIENFQELKNKLISRGHVFKSNTDTEVLVHLIEEEYKEGVPLEEAVRKAFQHVEGSYAVAVVSTKEPEKIVCVRKESPLVLGIGDGALYCASDIPAFLEYTRKAIILQDHDLAVLTRDGFRILSLKTGEPVEREVVTIDWTAEMASKGGYPHFMLKEIHEQPYALADTLRGREFYIGLISWLIENSKKVFLVAAGTSYHACLAGAYMLSRLAGVATIPVIASEFCEKYGDSVDSDTLVLAVSQSGETADTLNAVRYARKRGAKIASITNTLGSSITRYSQVYVLTQAGPEIGVAATKTFTTQLATFALISLKLAENLGNSAFDLRAIREELKAIPSLCEEVIRINEPRAQQLAKRYSTYENFYFLGRGISVATALEGALKLKEISYIHAEGYPAGESKHGPIALIQDNFPCVFVAPNDVTHPKIIGNIMEMKARGAKVISVIEEGDREVEELSNDTFIIPKGVSEVLTPILFVVPLQLFAYYCAVERGADPDKPRNLAKSVTVQ